jgi:SAM-dependent methyltransferase
MTKTPAIDDLRDSYDAVVEEYIERIFDELDHKPLDRELLDRFAARVGAGPCCDLGCGPGHVARYLFSRGANVTGIDLSPRMIERARQLNPGIEFRQGDMRNLVALKDGWAGIIAFYSIIHVPREHVTSVLQGLVSSLSPGGILLLSFHLGSETTHLDELWGKKVFLDFHFFERDEMEGYLRSAGFDIEEVVERAPYEGVEYPSRRAYIFATSPRAGRS